MRDNTVTLDEIKGEEPWTTAEQRLIEWAHTGVVWFGDEMPKTSTDENTIRAKLIRHVVLGGCAECRVSEKPVKVVGAWVSGQLDLEGCATRNDLGLYYCHLDQAPFLWDAHLGAVYLSGSHMPGLNAHRLRTDRDLHLRNGFRSMGPVDLASAAIGRQLDCSGGQFENSEGDALNADAITIGTDLHLRDGFSAKGRVNLRGASIGGQVDCGGGNFENAKGDALNGNAITIGGSLFLRNGFSAKGKVNLTRATINGQMSCKGGHFTNAKGDAFRADAITVGADLFLRDGFSAKGRVNLVRADIGGILQCQNGVFDGGFDGEAMRVKAGFFWFGVEKVSGTIDLTDAHVARLEDDLASWQMADKLILHGFRYDRTTGEMRLEDRLAWLAGKVERKIPVHTDTIQIDGKDHPFRPPYLRQDYGPDFDPQPYTQLARVLHEQGRRSDAAKLLEERDKRVQSASYRRVLAANDFSWRRSFEAGFAEFRRLIFYFFGKIFGYGHRPGKAVMYIAGILLLNTFLYHQAFHRGEMAPTSDVILASADWTDLVIMSGGKLDEQATATLLAWKDGKTAQDYTTFNAPLYALDLFIPLDALGQEEAWAPSPTRGWWGWVGFATGWFTQMLGWIFTAVIAAALTGFVGRKD
ncbi:hypothetical protein J7443_21715 [Tropicibacter sp. R15_0]|uniref:hypothetical protein n=1 Tax=Tropicibacter sp. R15_0 TaxID=2821101 RepID=UPI001ADB38E5|nr:hypothetical protein [Tropicibacter sp. R15_0]MBO9467863.1 hypothetical protein [Tropicibacter sp. R15_0]